MASSALASARSNVKIYDLRLKSYRTALEDFQPSWDGSVRRGRSQVTMLDYISNDLDELNGRYEWLVDVLHRRLQQLYAQAQQDLPDTEVTFDSIYFSYHLVFVPISKHVSSNYANHVIHTRLEHTCIHTRHNKRAFKLTLIIMPMKNAPSIKQEIQITISSQGS